MDPISLTLFAAELIADQQRKRATPAKTGSKATSAVAAPSNTNNSSTTNTEAIGEQPLLRQLDLCRSTIDTNNLQAHLLLETERRLIIDTLHEIQTSFLRIDVQQSLRRLLLTGTIPRSLHLTYAPGCLPYEQAANKCEFQVRGAGYLSSSKKVVSEAPLFFQRSIQVVYSESVHPHVARKSWCALPTTEPDNIHLIVNYILPGSPRIHVICIFTASPDALSTILLAQETFQNRLNSTSNNNGTGRAHRHRHNLFSSDNDQWQGWRGLLARMFIGHTANANHANPNHNSTNNSSNNTSSDTDSTTNTTANNSSLSNHVNLNISELDTDFLNQRLKLIPVMIEANWAVKMAVGQRPVLLGSKLPLGYHKGKNYLEIDIDMSFSSMATGIMGMVIGLSKQMIVDVGWTLQGEEENEIPERIFCQTKFQYVDLEGGTEVE